MQYLDESCKYYPELLRKWGEKKEKRIFIKTGLKFIIIVMIMAVSIALTNGQFIKQSISVPLSFFFSSSTYFITALHKQLSSITV